MSERPGSAGAYSKGEIDTRYGDNFVTHSIEHPTLRYMSNVSNLRVKICLNKFLIAMLIAIAVPFILTTIFGRARGIK